MVNIQTCMGEDSRTRAAQKANCSEAAMSSSGSAGCWAWQIQVLVDKAVRRA